MAYLRPLGKALSTMADCSVWW